MLRNGSSPVRPDATMKDQDLIKFIYLFIYFNFPVANPPERRCCCPLSIMFGAGTVSGLESSFPFYPSTVLKAERSWSEVSTCRQIKK